MRMSFAIVVALGSSACGSSVDSSPPSFAPPTLVDTNPDPDIVEVSLVAGPAVVEMLAPGSPADVWAFHDGSVADAAGTVPGPLLEAKLGDRVIVHFRNELPDATTIHWHGLRVPNTADGTPAAQVPVPPGGTYDYEMTLRDAGLFWYHPHVDADEQIERGLYAPFLVHGGVEPDVAADRVLVLDDVKLEASGQLSTRTDALDLMLGRQGNVLLVNGRRTPSLTAPAGSRERWRLVNVANGRYFQLVLAGRQLRVIGWDGGLIEEPYLVDRLLIAPGERYDVLVDLGGDEGDAVTLQTVHYDRGHGVPDPGPTDLMTIRLDAPGVAPAALPSAWGVVTPIETTAATRRRAFVLSEAVHGAEPMFMINGRAYPDIDPVTVTTGTTEIWEIENASEMDHPFHLHGMSFQRVDADGARLAPLGWKDTINVPRASTVRFAVELDALGTWMYHCHILEHAERGMMGELVVEGPP